MICRALVPRTLLLSWFLLLLSGWSIADAKTAHLTVKRSGDRQVLHVQYAPADSYATNVYVPPPPLPDHLFYGDLQDGALRFWEPSCRVDPYWQPWLQYRLLFGRWPRGF